MAGIDQLSERQKACLTYVGQGMSSKEIAKETGLSPRSVDTYLTDAMALLGATNRRDAARIFLSQSPSQELRSQSQRLAASAADRPAGWRAGLSLLQTLLLPIPVGGSVNDLNAAQKSLFALRIGITGVVLLLAIITVFVGLLTVF